MPKGISWAEATSNSEKNKASSLNRYRITLDCQAVSQKKISLNKIFKILWQLLKAV